MKTQPNHELTQLDQDIIGTVSALQQNRCESFVVIGVNKDGQMISMRRAGKEGSQPFAIIGALEAMKIQIVATEINRPAKKDPPEEN